MNKMIDELLQHIPDKCDQMSTTSHKFKKDLWEFCSGDGFRDLKVVELGTNNGQSTNVLSYLFDDVSTVNNNESTFAKEFNSDRDNIKFYNFDLYRHQWQLTEGDIFFIDADHSYSAVCMDIENCIKLKSSIENKIFIFDDYGSNQYVREVKLAVDKYIENGTLEVLGYIGHKPGHAFDETYNRTLSHYEGIICQEI